MSKQTTTQVKVFAQVLINRRDFAIFNLDEAESDYDGDDGDDDGDDDGGDDGDGNVLIGQQV